MAAIAVLLIALGSHAGACRRSACRSGASSAPLRRSAGARGSSRVLRDDAEAGGGLQVAVIQFAITIGAAVGGLMFDAGGLVEFLRLQPPFFLLGSSLAAIAAWLNWEHSK